MNFFKILNRICSITLLSTLFAPIVTMHADIPNFSHTSSLSEDSDRIFHALKKKTEKLLFLPKKPIFSQVAKAVIDLKKFTEDESGLKITYEDLFNEFKKKANETNFIFDEKTVSSIFTLLKDYENQLNDFSAKVEYSENPELDLPPEFIFGCVLMACSCLPAVIAMTCPPISGPCYYASGFMLSTGFGLVSAGTCEKARQNKKKWRDR